MVLDKIDGAKRPRPMRTNPSQKNMNFFCDYHGTHGHRTVDCRHLRDEVVRLLKDGYLREFLSDRAKDNYGKHKDSVKQEPQAEPRHVINMIINEPEQSKEVPEKKVLSAVRIETTEELKQKTTELGWKDVLLVGDILPRPNDLVISALVNSIMVSGIAVAPRSEMNLIQWDVVEQLVEMGEMELSEK
ncbi:uncharacterized protein LOC132624408 [Lycium barbarum]|uniref:uncharacterized protein LOC132624408 n=1 Tax=Lycium barbarum TaxID=112863 RepID=UPI00293F5B8E|nr:uncharacterized protein LOC132624408 [Lycium barbarum]